MVLRHTDGWDDPGSPHTAWGWSPTPGVQGAGLWLRECPGQAKALKHRWDTQTVIQGIGPNHSPKNDVTLVPLSGRVTMESTIYVGLGSHILGCLIFKFLIQVFPLPYTCLLSLTRAQKTSCVHSII